ncbi:hypothetical protein SAMN06297251_12250 [Fulvimarina manganoxydans]|uniref:Uncharacterized protein n=1 Tax=Fulvimarina manganoxydans TaxID=937218 RepID=A0A1W2E7E2_9HYPH|nr:hypothetical protein [Fulvimarina manganoxydans]MEE2953333.1 hypothetical protein [Pseudomonadota bacterium]SMD05693.1 hypothetical protein SAMN06297251_12250 [Fulvimarina manganoxydans]
MAASRDRNPILAALAMAAVLAAGPAYAQSQDSAPLPGTTISGEGEALAPIGAGSNLPGVGEGESANEEEPRGPGGLQNNIGAIGMSAPDTSSANPLPLQTDRAGEGGGIPLETPVAD